MKTAIELLNDYIIPAPGSLVTPVVQSLKGGAIYTVVAARQDVYPGPWKQYNLTLFGGWRLLNLDVECSDFHYNWHVLHRP